MPKLKIPPQTTHALRTTPAVGCCIGCSRVFLKSRPDLQRSLHQLPGRRAADPAGRRPIPPGRPVAPLPDEPTGKPSLKE